MNYREQYLEHRKSKLPKERWQMAMKRKEAGLTQCELAKEIGVNQNRISNFENNKGSLGDAEFFYFIYSVRFK